MAFNHWVPVSTAPSLVASVLVGLASAFVVFVIKLYRARMLLIDRRNRGLPVAPGHSFIFGHLLYLKSFLDRLPEDAHYQYGFATIARENFSDTGAFYMDLWPVSGLFLTVVSPRTAVHVTQENPHLTSERPALLRRFLKPITGGLTIFDLSERDWKPWRAVFNKGFQGERIMSLVPGMVEETLVYAKTLRRLAKSGERCNLDPITLRFTIDMIGKTILNSSLGAQRGPNVLADSMLSQVRWHSTNDEVNPFSNLNIVRWFVHWNNGRKMNQYIGAELDKRYNEIYKQSTTSNPSVIDLVLRSYVSDRNNTSAGGKPESTSASLPKKLDTDFRTFAIRQIRLFVFAGYDSTGSVICYCLHLLQKHPDILKRLREEHDKVLGANPSPAAAGTILSAQPRIVNSLVYTLAVIKETMRLFAPAGTTRAGKTGINITDDAGNSLPTDDAMIWILHVEMHRSAKYWEEPDAFIPERWLVGPEHRLHPRPGAWRPFEHGPRNCIAQALVLVELRVIVAMLARSFEVRPAYDEWDLEHPTQRTRLYRGERVYQVQEGAAHPQAHYPCRVVLPEPSNEYGILESEEEDDTTCTLHFGREGDDGVIERLRYLGV